MRQRSVVEMVRLIMELRICSILNVLPTLYVAVIFSLVKSLPVKKRNKVNYSFLSPIKRCLRLLGISHHK